LNGLRVQ